METMIRMYADIWQTIGGWLIFAAIVRAVVYGVIHLAKRILNMDTTRRQ